MTETTPDWLASALAGNAMGRLAIADLTDAGKLGRGGLKLTSPAFEHGEELDPCFTADEEDAVAPPLEWGAPPTGSMELVVIVEDADAPPSSSAANGRAPAHWLVWGCAAQKGKLLEGEVPPRVGKNAAGNSEWLLPQTPDDGKAHRYVFQLFALDLPLTLMPGADRDQLIQALEGHVIAASLLVGTYTGGEREEDWDDWEEGETT